MLSPANMRIGVIKYSSLTEHNPDYYFIQGYLIGLAVCPEMVDFPEWHSGLFGEISPAAFDSTVHIEALQQLYNSVMDKVMAQDLKMPAKCVLSKKDFAGSLAQGQPLPQWCLGLLKAFKLINKRKLTRVQKAELKTLTGILNGFTSVVKAKKQFLMLSRDYQVNAFEFKRLLTTYLSNTIYEMRFSEAAQSKQGGESISIDDVNQQMSDFISFVMSHDDVDIIAQISDVLPILEHAMGESFMAQNAGHFWGLTETRPYMRLRARRAQLHFAHGDVASAITELQTLLQLNPNDNQANRYPLANYLIIQKSWHELADLIDTYSEQSLFMLAADALACFALTGDSAQAKQLKHQLKQVNPHFEAYITGQKKAPKEATLGYSTGDKSEVFCYLDLAGKEVWRSVEGALFWLRKK